MNQTRTTLRLQTDLVKEAKKLALETNTTFQNVLNTALATHLGNQKTKQTKGRITFIDYDLGVDLTNINRDLIYDNPDIEKP